MNDPIQVLRNVVIDWSRDTREWAFTVGTAEAALAQVEALVEAARSIERMAGAAGSGETPAMPIATCARDALAPFKDNT